MNLDSFTEKLNTEKIKYRKNEIMKSHTTFKIGGKADVFVMPENKNELKILLNSAKENDVPFFIIGKGSNLLVSDNGIEGAVISLSRFDDILVSGNTIKCGAGVKLSSLCSFALKNSLAGLEFAYGIPGSVGGALFMNAGAYGGEISQVVSGAFCIDFDGNEVFLKREDMNLSYRNSVFKNSNLIILEVVFELETSNSSEIKAKMQEYIEKRKAKQPLEYPSAGSTFKRPVGNFAGTLIEKNGLKGELSGGAMVSDKHAGFIINYDNATANDVLNLMDKVQKTVLSNDNVLLEPEVIFVGRR